MNYSTPRQCGCLFTGLLDICGVQVPAGTKPCCYMCCPQNYTEQWFMDHPDQYSRHPAMFLGQVSTDDVQADGCAAKYYHEAMQVSIAFETMQARHRLHSLAAHNALEYRWQLFRSVVWLVP